MITVVMSLSGRKSQVSIPKQSNMPSLKHYYLLHSQILREPRISDCVNNLPIFSIALILKENADSIVSSLNNQTEKSELLLTSAFKLTKEMKVKKIKDMRTIDD